MEDVYGLRGRDAVAPRSWETLVRDHLARVQRHARHLTGHTQEAEDLAQEVFIRAFRGLAAADPHSIEAWLYRITSNAFINTTRRRQPQDRLTETLAERLVGVGPIPAEALDARTVDDDVEAALDDLTPSHRAAVVLRDLEGLSYAEVASTLGIIKLGTARSQIHRGRAQLRIALAHRSPVRHRASSSTSTARQAA